MRGLQFLGGCLVEVLDLYVYAVCGAAFVKARFA